MKFKDYNQNQTILLSYSFNDLIPEKHPVRAIDQVVSLNIQPLLKAYSKEGNPEAIIQRYCLKCCCMGM